MQRQNKKGVRPDLSSHRTVKLKTHVHAMAAKLAAATEGYPSVERYIEMLIENDMEAYNAAEEPYDLSKPETPPVPPVPPITYQFWIDGRGVEAPLDLVRDPGHVLDLVRKAIKASSPLKVDSQPAPNCNLVKHSMAIPLAALFNPEQLGVIINAINRCGNGSERFALAWAYMAVCQEIVAHGGRRFPRLAKLQWETLGKEVAL